MKLINDVLYFIKSLSFVDIIFFVAIITLLILIVTLIYFIKINNDVLGEDDFFPPSSGDNDKDDSDTKEEEKEEEPPVEEYNDEEGELLDLESLTKKLQEEKFNASSITSYEKDQEEKAIISYDELIKKRNKYAVNYEKEEILDDLVVKKVNLNDLENKNIIDEIKEVRVISYEKEEAFLNTLKELNRLLN